MQTASLPQPTIASVNSLLSATDKLLEPFGLDCRKYLAGDEQRENLDKYMSIGHACKHTSVSRWTLHRAIKSGQLPAFKFSPTRNGKVLIKRADLDKWVQSHRINVGQESSGASHE